MFELFLWRKTLCIQLLLTISQRIHPASKCAVTRPHRAYILGCELVCVCQSSIHEQREQTSPSKQVEKSPGGERRLCLQGREESDLNSRRVVTLNIVLSSPETSRCETFAGTDKRISTGSLCGTEHQGLWLLHYF